MRTALITVGSVILFGLASLSGCSAIGATPRTAAAISAFLDPGAKSALATKQGEVVYAQNVALPDGATYTGNLLLQGDGKLPHGYGTCVWPTGEKYIGQIEFGRMNGKGLFIKSDGVKLEGEWINGVLQGPGFVTNLDGQRYIAQFKDGQLQVSQNTPPAPNSTPKQPQAKAPETPKAPAAAPPAPAAAPEAPVAAAPKPAAEPKAPPAEEKTGQITILSECEDCDVYLDGTFVGNTPAKLKVAAGSHLIEIKKNGCDDYTRKIKVDPEAELTLRPTLNPREDTSASTEE